MGPGFGSFPRGSSYPSLFLPYCCKYFNKTEKEKKKTKKSKKRKSHHLKPPGTCSPGQPGLSPEQSSGQPWQPGLPVLYIPARAGSRQSRFYTPESNSETKNPSFPAPGPVTSALSVLHQSALLGRVPHCLPRWPGDTLTPKDAFAEMAALPL